MKEMQNLFLTLSNELLKIKFVALCRLNPVCTELQFEVAQDPHNQSIVDQRASHKHHSFNSCAYYDGDHLSMRRICGPIIGKSCKLGNNLIASTFSDPSTRNASLLSEEPSGQYYPNPFQ